MDSVWVPRQSFKMRHQHPIWGFILYDKECGRYMDITIWSEGAIMLPIVTFSSVTCINFIWFWCHSSHYVWNPSCGTDYHFYEHSWPTTLSWIQTRVYLFSRGYHYLHVFLLPHISPVNERTTNVPANEWTPTGNVTLLISCPMFRWRCSSEYHEWDGDDDA